MRANPLFGLAPVRACAPKVDQHEGDDEGQDEELLLEVRGRGALPDAVPFRVRNSGQAGGLRELGHDTGGCDRLNGRGRGRSYTGEVGKICSIRWCT